MKVRKRSWKNKDGKKGSSWSVDFIDAASKKRVREVLRDDTGFRNVSSERAAWEVAIRLYGKQATDPTAAAMEQAPDGVTMTLQELLTKHRARVGIEPTTMQIEKHQATMLMARLGNDTPLSRISLSDLDLYAELRQQDTVQKHSLKKVSGATILKELKLLNQALKWATSRHMAVRDPFPVLPAIRYEKYQPRCLSTIDLAALLQACGPDAARMRQTTEILYLTGLRRSELFRLCWANVDFQKRQLRFLTMKGGVSATRVEDIVYLPERAIDLLKLRLKALSSAPDQASLIFGVTPYHIGDFETTVDPQYADDLAAAARRAGLDKPNEVGPHVLRHTCATHLIEQGAKIPEVAAHLRHRDGGALLLRTYAHANEAGLRAAAAGLSGEQPKNDKAQKGTKETRKAVKTT